MIKMNEPKSMDECYYFTNRTINNGRIRAWVFKEKCPKCQQSLMSKPKDKKTGKAKIRAKEYVCSSCGHEVNVENFEETLNINIKYICPYCENQDEVSMSYKNKKVKIVDEEGNKKSVEAIRFQCSKCQKNIDIVEKMKS